MRLALYTSGRKRRDDDLAQALHDGGDLDVHVVDQSGMLRGFDLHAVVGVSGGRVVRGLEASGAPWLFFDKAYNRDWPEWWRVSYGAHQPVAFLERATCSIDRASTQGWVSRIEPWREADPRKHVLFAGASPNYHLFHDLPDPTDYAQRVVNELLRKTQRPVIYRPKPQWLEAVGVSGSQFSHSPVKVKGRKIRADLEGAHVMITHGSSACLEALLAGVPVIALGGAVVRPISSTSLDDVDHPRVPSDQERLRLIANLAYCQWSIKEFRAGTAWRYIKEHFTCA